MANEGHSPDTRATAQVQAFNQQARAKTTGGKSPRLGRLGDRHVEATEAGSRQIRVYDEQFANKKGVFLTPPFPLNELATLMETCGPHYACVKAKAAAISGVGWKLEPQVNQQALTAELNRILGLPLPRDSEDEAKMDAILTTIARLKFEYEELLAFFNRPNANFGETWVEINRRRDEDCEALGNGFWEVVRRYAEPPSEIYHMPAITVRLLANGRGVAQAQKLPPFAGAVPAPEQSGYRIVYFKFFGEPWIMDYRTGDIWGVFIVADEESAFRRETAGRDPETGERCDTFRRAPAAVEAEWTLPKGYVALWRADAGREPYWLDATFWAGEVIWLKKYSVRQGDGYGVPDIVAAMPAVTGSDAAHQYQIDLFDNQAVPAHVVHLKGFPLGNPDEGDSIWDSTDDYFENQLRGPGNAGKTLIVQSPPAIKDAATGFVEGGADIQIERLAEPIQEASFLGYLRNNFDEILRVERTPVEMIATLENTAKPSSNGISIGIEVFKSFVIRPEQAVREHAINRLIQEGFGYDWTFKFAEIDTLDELREMEVATGYYNIHALTTNEIRAKMGRDPVPGGDRIFIVTPTGVLFLDEMEQLTTSQTAALPENPLSPADSGKGTGRGNGALPAIGPTGKEPALQNRAKEGESSRNAYGLDPRVQWFLTQQFGWMDRKTPV